MKTTSLCAKPQSTDNDNWASDFSYQGHKAEEGRAEVYEEKHLIARLKKSEPMCYMNKEKINSP